MLFIDEMRDEQLAILELVGHFYLVCLVMTRVQKMAYAPKAMHNNEAVRVQMEALTHSHTDRWSQSQFTTERRYVASSRRRTSPPFGWMSNSHKCESVTISVYWSYSNPLVAQSTAPYLPEILLLRKLSFHLCIVLLIRAARFALSFLKPDSFWFISSVAAILQKKISLPNT